MKKIAIALATVTLAATPAAFADRIEFPFNFDFNRYELSTEEGAKAVYKRLQKDIEQACGVSKKRRSLITNRAERKCILEATETALEKIGSANLYAAHGVTTQTKG